MPESTAALPAAAPHGGGFILLPLIAMSVVIAVLCCVLAKDKGRNVILWAVLGLIPIYNLFFMWYCIGATNRRIEEKLDRLLKQAGIS